MTQRFSERQCLARAAQREIAWRCLDQRFTRFELRHPAGSEGSAARRRRIQKEVRCLLALGSAGQAE